jgi:uncharacterized protein YbjT (DUF2867 family)
MNVFITGGSGFVGKAVIKALLDRGHSIHALVKNKPIDIASDRVKSFKGDLFDNSILETALRDCDAAIHLVGIIRQHPSRGITFDRIHYQGTVHVVDAVKRAGIRRYIHMSALGANPKAESIYLRTKFQAEEYVRASGLNWTIFEPSLIHGPGGEFTQMQEAWARGKSVPFFFMPYFGGGFKIQPVFVEDVARAFAESLENPKTVGETIPIGGPEQMSWPKMHHIASGVIVGHPRLTVPVPAWYAKAITHVLPSALLPFTHDQVLMSQQDNVCDLTRFTDTFGWMPQAFESSLRSYVKRNGNT